MEEYNKIVRDNIPTIIENSGFKCETEIVSDEEALLYLYTKVQLHQCQRQWCS